MADSALPKVSIGLPVRNGARFLEEALLSLATQDYGNLEIIVSDNGSTDATAEILAKVCTLYPSIRVITQTETLAATDNFTYVLGQATGEYFCWAADDDVRAPGSIRRLVAALDSHPELVCVMSDVVNLYDGTERRTLDRLDGIRLEKVLADWPKVRRLFFEVPTSNVFFCVYGLYRTEALRRVRMKMNLGFSANTEIPMLAQVALLGGIASIEEEGFIYRRHGQSIYHMETAAEDEAAPVRRRNIVRDVVENIVSESSLGEEEKAAIMFDLRRGRTLDAEAEQKRLTKESDLQKRKSQKSRRNLPRKRRGFFSRLTRRVRRWWIEGGTSSVSPPTPSKKPASGSNRTLPDELLVKRKLNLEKPKLRKLVKREEARQRLEKKGWCFEETKVSRIINNRQITTLIDCGANAGQYVENLQKTGWTGKVFSFEPLSDAYATLRTKAEASEQWQAFHFALGERNEESLIRIAGNSYSSSLLEFSTDFKELRPDASPVGSETVTIRRLDDVVKEEGLAFDGPVMLKLDVQGFELSVLRGARETLPRVSVLQCELALIPSYEGGATFVEVREFLRERGFVLAHLIDGHANHETGELREVDGIFLNTRLVPGDA